MYHGDVQALLGGIRIVTVPSQQSIEVKLYFTRTCRTLVVCVSHHGLCRRNEGSLVIDEFADGRGVQLWSCRCVRSCHMVSC